MITKQKPEKKNIFFRTQNYEDLRHAEKNYYHQNLIAFKRLLAFVLHITGYYSLPISVNICTIELY